MANRHIASPRKKRERLAKNLTEVMEPGKAYTARQLEALLAALPQYKSCLSTDTRKLGSLLRGIKSIETIPNKERNRYRLV